MANSDKDILITPNTGETNLPEISFIGFSNTPIKLRVLDDNTVSFEGSAGQLFSINNNLTTGNIFTVNDVSGIPGLAYNANGTLQLTPYSGNTAVGGTTAIGRLHIHQDPAAINSPTLVLPDNTNPRFSVGFNSVNVTNIGQRLDFFAGDSGSNTANLGSTHIRMSLRADGRLGIRNTAPISIVDARPILYSNNQAADGYTLGTTGGQWISRFFMSSDSTGVPYTGIQTPADASGGVMTAIEIRGSNANQIRLRPGNTDLFYADPTRIGINKTTSFDGNAIVDIDGRLRLRQNIGILDRNIDVAGWNIMYEKPKTTLENVGTLWGRTWVDYSPPTFTSTSTTQYGRYHDVISRNNHVSNSSRNGWRLGGRFLDAEYTVSQITPVNGNSTITVTSDVPHYGPFNITGVQVTNYTPNPESPQTVDVYIDFAAGHQFYYGMGITVSGVGTNIDGNRTIFRIVSPTRIRIRCVNPTLTPTTSGGNVRGLWFRAALYDTGTAVSGETYFWDDRFTLFYDTTAANPARRFFVSGNRASWPSSITGRLRIYTDWTNNHQGALFYNYIGNGDQQNGWSDYAPSLVTGTWNRTGNLNNQRNSISYCGTATGTRNHVYNRFGGRTINGRGVENYVRNERSGRFDNMFGTYNEVLNGTVAGYTRPYSGQQWGLYNYVDARTTARTNDMRGNYNFVRAGISTTHTTIVNNMRGSWNLLRADGGTVTNAYMYGGDYFINSTVVDPTTRETLPAGTPGAVNAAVITNRWGLYLTNEDRNYLSGRLGIGTTTPTANNAVRLVVNGSIQFENNALIASAAGQNNNVDHIWHDDNTTDSAPGTWHFCSDVGYKAAGNSRIQCGQIDATQTAGTNTFSGALTVTGTKNFRISHPLEELKETNYLLHATVESPQMDLIYRGSSILDNGKLTINIDEYFGMTEGTFVALCRNAQCFTTNETGWEPVKGKVTGNILEIECKDITSTDQISWMVVAERQDDEIKASPTTDEEGNLILEPLK